MRESGEREREAALKQLAVPVVAPQLLQLSHSLLDPLDPLFPLSLSSFPFFLVRLCSLIPKARKRVLARRIFPF